MGGESVPVAQMDAYKRASGMEGAPHVVETRKLADYLPYSMEIDAASMHTL